MMAYLTVHIRGWDPRHIAKHIDVLAMGRDRGVFGLKNISHKVLSKFGNVVTVDKDFDQRFVPVPVKKRKPSTAPPVRSLAWACLTSNCRDLRRNVCFEDVTFAVKTLHKRLF